MSGGHCSSALKSSLLFLYGSNERGIMLMDLLLSLALALLMIGVVQQVAGLIFSSYRNNSNQAELLYSARVALDCIEQDIRTSQNFQVSADGSKLIITGAGGEYICIYAGSGNLYRTYEGTVVPVAENCSAVSFARSGSRLQGRLQLENQEDDYEIEFFCFSRVRHAQE